MTNSFIKTFKFFIILCVVAIFPQGLFNYYIPELRNLKIISIILIGLMIIWNLFLRTPVCGNIKNLLMFSFGNGMILFLSLFFGNYFTYILIQSPKYMEHWLILTGLQLIFVLFSTFILILLNRLIKQCLPTTANTKLGIN